MRQSPNILAKDCKLKTVKKGLDGKMWIVSKRLDGVKFWKRKTIEKKGGSNNTEYIYASNYNSNNASNNAPRNNSNTLKN